MRFVIVATAFLASTASSQAPRAYRNVGIGTVSPAVFAIIVTTFPSSASVNGRLELMTLFRGSPGWMLKVVQATPRPPRFTEQQDQQRWSYDMQVSGHDLTIQYDGAAHAASINGRRVELAEHENVITIDGVDDPAGGQIKDVIAIAPDIEIPFDDRRRINDGPTLDFVARSGLLIGFLQCDANVSDPPDRPDWQQMRMRCASFQKTR